MLLSYYTVKHNERHVLIEQKSKFIASVSRAENEQSAQSFIEQVKHENRDAHHNCSAYLIGMQNKIQKANDDGEPTGTAGLPILEVIKKNQLKNTVIVVTRYFGGIKLGAGGLIRAYGSAASGGIQAAGMVQCKLSQVIKLTFDYSWIGKIENELISSAYQIKDTHYMEHVTIEVYVPVGKTKTFSEWMTNLTNGQTNIVEGETVYLEEGV